MVNTREFRFFDESNFIQLSNYGPFVQQQSFRGLFCGPLPMTPTTGFRTLAILHNIRTSISQPLPPLSLYNPLTPLANCSGRKEGRLSSERASLFISRLLSAQLIRRIARPPSPSSNHAHSEKERRQSQFLKMLFSSSPQHA